MDEQLETSSVRVRDAAVSLAERGPRRGPLFLDIEAFKRLKNVHSNVGRGR